MEDLVHDLINVALGRDGDYNDRHRSQSSPDLEERSRSTWAEVFLHLNFLFLFSTF